MLWGVRWVGEVEVRCNVGICFWIRDTEDDGWGFRGVAMLVCDFECYGYPIGCV